jgi:hypothetical protein
MKYRSLRKWLRSLCIASALAACNEEGGASSASAECHASPMPGTLHEGGVTGLAIDGDDALFVDGALWRIPLAGGSPTKVADVDGAYGLVSAAGFAYLTGEHVTGAAGPKTTSEPALYAVPLDGGDPVWVRDQFTLDYAAADAHSVYIAGASNGVLVYTPPSTDAVTLGLGTNTVSLRALAEHGAYVYAAAEDLSNLDKPHGAIQRIAKTGGAAKTLITTDGLPDDLAVDDQGIYWIEEAPYGTFGDGHIARSDLDGKHVESLAGVSASSIAIDDEYVYFVAEDLSRVPKLGGAVTALVKGLKGPGLLRISGADAVWVDRASKAKSDPTPSSLMAVCTHGARR